MSESFGSMALPVRDFLAEEHRRQSVDIRDAAGSELQVRQAHWHQYGCNIQSGETNKGMYAALTSCMQFVDVQEAAVSEHQVGLARHQMPQSFFRRLVVSGTPNLSGQ